MTGIHGQQVYLGPVYRHKPEPVPPFYLPLVGDLNGYFKKFPEGFPL
jgi:hypothetical protein